MTLDDLTRYAQEKYHIQEKHVYPDFPAFTVLDDPVTGERVAFLVREWDSDSGTEYQYCDIKCGQRMLQGPHPSCFSRPFQMRGVKWLGVRLDDTTDSETVFALLDKAITSGDQRGYTMVLEPDPEHSDDLYLEPDVLNPDDFIWDDLTVDGEPPHVRPGSSIPEQIRQMRQIYTKGNGSHEHKAEIFYLQARFMEDYEDNVPWMIRYTHYYPTYNDLSPLQLREYFSWRTCIRNGDYRPASSAFPYLYIYELLMLLHLGWVTLS